MNFADFVGWSGTVTAMATRFEHSVDHPFSTARLGTGSPSRTTGSICSRRSTATTVCWRNSPRAGDTVTVAMTQSIPEAKLPSIITTVRRGDLKIPRRFTLKYAGGNISGDTRRACQGVGRHHGSQISSGDKASTLYRGEIKVSIPFVGGKIERIVKNELVDLFNSERDETISWESRNRSQGHRQPESHGKTAQLLARYRTRGTGLSGQTTPRYWYEMMAGFEDVLAQMRGGRTLRRFRPQGGPAADHRPRPTAADRTDRP